MIPTIITTSSQGNRLHAAYIYIGSLQLHLTIEKPNEALQNRIALSIKPV